MSSVLIFLVEHILGSLVALVLYYGAIGSYKMFNPDSSEEDRHFFEKMMCSQEKQNVIFVSILGFVLPYYFFPVVIIMWFHQTNFFGKVMNVNKKEAAKQE